MAPRGLGLSLGLCTVLLALPGALGACQQPPRFVFAEPPLPLKDSYDVGTMLRYSCRPGYRMAGDKSPMVTCLPSSEWSSDPDFCIGKSCVPPEIMNGNFEFTTDLTLGATINYTCDFGYRLVGNPSAQCVVTGNKVSWTSVPHCTIVPCPPPPAIENGQLLDGGRDFVFGMAATYSCNKDFSLIGDATIHCTVDDNLEGVWSGPAPQCKTFTCENPEVKNGRKSSGFRTEYKYKDTVIFECDPGYLMKGDSIVVCEADSTWKPPLPTCDPVVCGPAPLLPFAEPERAVGSSFLAGTQLEYRCKPGYTAASGKSSLVTCTMDATWSADPDFCIRQQCPSPTLKNGDVIADNFLFESVVTFTCYPGYELKGSSSATCVATGNGVAWDAAFPQCERQLRDVVCEEPPTIDNGKHNGTKGTKFVSGSVVVYKCNDGFTLAGAAFLQCVPGDQHWGVWSKPAPECRGQQCPSPTLKNGDVIADNFLFESVVTFTCYPGYELKGSSSATCVATGNGVAWDAAFPQCERQLRDVVCEEPPTIDNGKHNGTKGTKFVSGSVVVYKCNDGFTLAGAAFLQCVPGDQHWGVWSKPAPECRDGANMIVVGIFPLLLTMLVMNL